MSRQNIHFRQNFVLMQNRSCLHLRAKVGQNRIIQLLQLLTEKPKIITKYIYLYEFHFCSRGPWGGSVGKCGCGLTSVGHMMLAALSQEAGQKILSEHWDSFRKFYLQNVFIFTGDSL